MPLYEYKCRRCSHRFEALVAGSSKPVCPRCGGRSLEKIPSVFAAHKRGGFPAPARAVRPSCPCGDPGRFGACDVDPDGSADG